MGKKKFVVLLNLLLVDVATLLKPYVKNVHVFLTLYPFVIINYM